MANSKKPELTEHAGFIGPYPTGKKIARKKLLVPRTHLMAGPHPVGKKRQPGKLEIVKGVELVGPWPSAPVVSRGNPAAGKMAANAKRTAKGSAAKGPATRKR